MPILLAVLVALSLLWTEPPVQLVQVASVQQTLPSQPWSYSFSAYDDSGGEPQPLTIEDSLDLRLVVVEMSEACTEAAPNIVRCRVTPPATVVITVRIRSNACEPDVCRDMEWTIRNTAHLVELPIESNTTEVRITRLGGSHPRPQRPVHLPVILH